VTSLLVICKEIKNYNYQNDSFISCWLAPITSRREDKDYTFPPWSTSTQTAGRRRSLDTSRRHI